MCPLAGGAIVDKDQLTTLAAEIVAAHVANNTVPAAEVPALLRSICTTLAEFTTVSSNGSSGKVPAVAVENSIDPDYLTCLACGHKHRTLTRHLRMAHAMSPDEYRASFGLPGDYPMNAATYSALRGKLAKAAGLGSGTHSRQKKNFLLSSTGTA
jgi:predicted transcriptional regulator